MDIKEFAECNTFEELIALSKRLKEQGESAIEVNQLVTKRRKELLQAPASFKELSKVAFNPRQDVNTKITHLSLQDVKNLSGNCVTIANGNTLQFKSI